MNLCNDCLKFGYVHATPDQFNQVLGNLAYVTLTLLVSDYGFQIYLSTLEFFGLKD